MGGTRKRGLCAGTCTHHLAAAHTAACAHAGELAASVQALAAYDRAAGFSDLALSARARLGRALLLYQARLRPGRRRGADELLADIARCTCRERAGTAVEPIAAVRRLGCERVHICRLGPGQCSMAIQAPFLPWRV